MRRQANAITFSLMIMTLLVFWVMSVFAQNISPSRVLATLNAKGTADQGGVPAKAEYLIKANSAGELDPSWVPGLATAWVVNRVIYVDTVNGIDTNAGTAVLPVKTLSAAAGLAVSRGWSSVTLVVSPGYYSGLVISSPVLTAIMLKGWGNETVTVASLTWNSVATSVRTDLEYVTVSSVAHNNAATASYVNMYSGARTSGISGQPANKTTVRVFPGADASGTNTNIVIVPGVYASEVSYYPATPSEWSTLDTQTTVDSALNVAGSRMTVSEMGLLSLSSELDTAQANIISISSELDTAQANIISISSELDTAQVDINALQTWAYTDNFSIGTGSDTDVVINFSTGQVPPPAIRKLFASTDWQLSNDGALFSTIAVFDQSVQADDYLKYMPGNVLKGRSYAQVLTDLGLDSAVINPMTAPGDLVVGGVSGVPEKLEKGTARKLLGVSNDGTQVEWQARYGTALYDYLYADASVMQSTITDSAVLYYGEYGASKINLSFRAFPKDTVARTQINRFMPEDWDPSSPLKLRFDWTSGVAGSTGATVEWSARMAVLSDGSAVDTAYGDWAYVSDALTADSGVNMQRSVSVSVSPAISPTAGSLIILEIIRNTGGADTLNDDARLFGTAIQYKRLDVELSGW